MNIITDTPPAPALTDDTQRSDSRILETVLHAVSELAVLWAFGLALLLVLAHQS